VTGVDRLIKRESIQSSFIRMCLDFTLKYGDVVEWRVRNMMCSVLRFLKVKKKGVPLHVMEAHGGEEV
jgi:hypothetical protein